MQGGRKDMNNVEKNRKTREFHNLKGQNVYFNHPFDFTYGYSPEWIRSNSHLI